MKEFTKEEIENIRKFCEENKISREEFDLHGDRVVYYVLPETLNQDFPNFVLRCTGKLSDGYIFAVSNSIKKEYRKYVIAHEYIEFMKFGIDTLNRCVKALEKELKLVPESIKPDYLIMRRNFFRDLLDYYADEERRKKSGVTEDDLKEFKKSLDKLEDLVHRISR